MHIRPMVLMVVEEGEQNVADQRILERALWDQFCQNYILNLSVVVMQCNLKLWI